MPGRAWRKRSAACYRQAWNLEALQAAARQAVQREAAELMQAFGSARNADRAPYSPRVPGPDYCTRRA